MAYVTWTDDLKVGVRQSDADHKEFVEIMNHLHESITAGIEATKLIAIVDRLLAFAARTTKYEEDLFDKTGYPNAATHRGLHKVAFEMLAHFRESITHAEKDAPATELLLALKGLALLQMHGEERRFGEFLYSKGIH